MKMKTITVLLVFLTIGCARSTQHTGEFQPFLCSMLEAHGTVLPKSIPLYPDLPTSWQSRQDKDGIVIHTTHEDFQAINTMLRGIFGGPTVWTEKNDDGFSMGVFGSRETGCAVQILDSKDQSEVIILRSQ